MLQDAKELGKKVAKHLLGKHKPFWHPETDCGDHVVVVNCQQVAMHAFDWKHTLYHFNKVRWHPTPWPLNMNPIQRPHDLGVSEVEGGHSRARNSRVRPLPDSVDDGLQGLGQQPDEAKSHRATSSLPGRRNPGIRAPQHRESGTRPHRPLCSFGTDFSWSRYSQLRRSLPSTRPRSVPTFHDSIACRTTTSWTGRIRWILLLLIPRLCKMMRLLRFVATVFQ